MDANIPDNLEKLKRNKLQSLCKTFGIPANLKNVELIRRLEEVRQQQTPNNQQQVVSNGGDIQSDTSIVTLPVTGEGGSVDEELPKDDHIVCDDNNNDDNIVMVTATDEENNDTKKKVANRRRRRAGQGRKQRRGRKTNKITTSNGDVMMDDVVMDDVNEEQCSERSNNGNYGDSSTNNVPPVIYTPAKEIINEDNMISSSAKRRRKCWSEVQHNESIEELFDRMASATNTPPLVDMDTNINSDTAAEGDHVQSLATANKLSEVEDTQDDDDDVQPPKKRRRRSTFDVEPSTSPSSVNNAVQPNNTMETPSSSTRSSLSKQYMKQNKHKSSSLITEQSLSPLVTNSQSATSGATTDDDEINVKEQVTAMLEDRVKLRKSQCAGEMGGSTTTGCKRTLAQSLATHNSKIPLPKCASKSMTAKDFDKIHQKNFKRSQSILDYHNRRQQQLSALTPVTNSNSSVNKSTTSVKSSTTGYQFKQTKPQLNHTVSSAGVYRFKAKPSIASVENKRHKETADRRKSYNAQNSAKKKPRAYKPYTGKLPPVQPIRNY